MGKKVIQQRKRLAAIFVSFTILTVGGLSLFECMSIDYYSVVYALRNSIPACIVMGALGWVMGMVLDKPKKKQHSISYNDLFLNNIMKDSQADSSLEDLEKEANAEMPEISGADNPPKI